MKNIKLLDALPSVFGLIALLGVALVYLTKGNASEALSAVLPIAVVGGVLLTFITGVLSIVTALTGLKKTRFQGVQWLNVAWLALMVAMVGIVLVSFSNWSITTF